MSIYKKLLEVQKEVGAISKDSKNPFFKSKYFDINQLIEHVQPVLSSKGLVLLQPIKEGFVVSEIIDSETNEKIESSLELPTFNDPQKLGSCVSYYRRYTLSSLLGLQATDEDGNGLNPSKPKPVQKPKPVEKPKVKDWKGLSEAIEKGDVTKEKALSTYDLDDKEKEKINKLELIKK